MVQGTDDKRASDNAAAGEHAAPAAPTLEELSSVDSEVTEALAELVEKAEADSRDNPVIMQQQGFEMRRQRGSMVRYGDVPLPERVTVFDRLGNPSQVPLVQVQHHLAKRDRAGNRKFFSKPPPDAPPPPKPIDQTCDFCLKRGVRKNFLSIDAYEGHMQAYHPREFGRILREQERRDRREEREAILALARQRDARTEPAPVSQAELQVAEPAVRCPVEGCGWVPKPGSLKQEQHRLRMHNRVRHGGE